MSGEPRKFLRIGDMIVPICDAPPGLRAAVTEFADKRLLADVAQFNRQQVHIDEIKRICYVR